MRVERSRGTRAPKAYRSSRLSEGGGGKCVIFDRVEYNSSNSHDRELLRRRQELGKPVEIGSDVWVGGGAIICPGVKIGSKTVIGAGSVVTRNIPEGAFAAGNPCRVIREIAEEV